MYEADNHSQISTQYACSDQSLLLMLSTSDPGSRQQGVPRRGQGPVDDFVKQRHTQYFGGPVHCLLEYMPLQTYPGLPGR